MNPKTLRFPDNLAPKWRELLAEEKDKGYFQKLTQFLKNEDSQGRSVYPPREKILHALQSVDHSDVKVVILGQDPYHGAGQAMGLAFAVPNSLRLKPPSLQNIFKEISANFGVDMKSKESELSGWVQQGVLLLNTVLSVRASEAFSHRKQGWELFTDQVLRHLNNRQDPIVFLLWGSPARSKKNLITAPQHRILEAAHPSPLSASRGFFGCQHFLKTNEILKSLSKQPIDWTRTGTL